MSTVGDLVDRVLRESVSRPDEEPVQTTAVGSMTDVATSVVYVPFAMPEEEGLLGTGSVIEMDSELIRVTNVDTATQTLTLRRAIRGTTATTHAAGASIFVAPPFSRQSIFDTVADSIVDLYPDLYRVVTEYVDSTQLTEISDLNAETIISVRYLDGRGRWQETQAEFAYGLEAEVGEDTLALLLPPEAQDRECYVTYRGSFTRPTSEADTFATLGLSESWQRLILLDVVSYLVALLGPDQIQSEFVTEALEEAVSTPGEEQSLAVSLVRLRATYLDRAKKAQRKRHRPKVRMREAY